MHIDEIKAALPAAIEKLTKMMTDDALPLATLESEVMAGVVVSIGFEPNDGSAPWRVSLSVSLDHGDDDDDDVAAHFGS